MTLSRLAPALAIAALGQPAAATPPLTAEQALAEYRKVIKTTKELDCPRSEGGEEIVVCRGRAGADPERLPLPVERVPGERVSGGMNGVGALAADGCISRCGGSVGVNILAIPAFVGRVIERLKDN